MVICERSRSTHQYSNAERERTRSCWQHASQWVGEGGKATPSRPLVCYKDYPVHVQENLTPRTRQEDPMPSTSRKQARTMRAASHNPAFAKKMGIPQKVAREFERADRRKGKR